MAAIAREIAWRRARYNWQYMIGHLAAEHNMEADAISKLSAPDRLAIPASLDRAANRPVHAVSAFRRLR